MNRLYEVMFIVRPDMADEDIDKLVSGFEASVSGAHGTVQKIDRMGKRRLAYPVQRFIDGNYILLTVEGAGETVLELERRMRVSEPVIKFITVRVDEEQKRLDKVKKIRASRVKRAPAPPPITPATVSTPEPAGTEPTAV